MDWDGLGGRWDGDVRSCAGRMRSDSLGFLFFFSFSFLLLLLISSNSDQNLEYHLLRYFRCHLYRPPFLFATCCLLNNPY
jgi:asparagine N-glycosylation enzyme membrane subunit Stt3